MFPAAPSRGAPALLAAETHTGCAAGGAYDAGVDDFDIDAFLAQPLVARVAAVGPSVRPVWYLWEDGCFWWLTGSYAALPRLVERDPEVALVVDVCDLSSGVVRQVVASGRADVVPLDGDRARRTLARYLGGDEASWDRRFADALADPDTRLVRLAPRTIRARDQSYRPPRTS